MNYTIDATNKSLGRVATEAAALLLGKNETTFARNTVSENTVIITNASKLKVDPRKMLEKTYNSFSGYPGGLKQSTMAHVTESKGFREVLTVAIKGMLPSNRLRNDMMKHLTVTE
jgi:large subunit ribosomal protein L13